MHKHAQLHLEVHDGLAGFLKNGNELGELLIEGTNPYGSQLLKNADVDQMRNHIRPKERVLAYVLGRVVMSGRGLIAQLAQDAAIQGWLSGDEAAQLRQPATAH